MPVVRNMMVRAGADFSSITKQANKAKASMSSMKAGVTRSCSAMKAAASSMKSAFAALGITLSGVALISFAKSAREAYQIQIEGETKLATVMRQRMGASAKEIQQIKDLCSAQQALGVIGDEVQLSGAQQLATFLKQTSSLNTLIPAMNNLIAQQKGLNATTEKAYMVGNMMGKAMQGQASALRRVGITFSEAEEKVLKYGNEQQRAAMLAQIITNNVGRMNQALAATENGRLKQVSNTLDDIKETAGGAVTRVLTVFLPALQSLCSVLSAVATYANKAAQAFANIFGQNKASAASSASYTSAAADSMDDLADATTGAAAASKKLGTFSFDQLQMLSSSSSSASSSAGGAAASTGGSVVPGTDGADEAGESLSWLEKCLKRLKATVKSIDTTNLSNSLDRLRKAAEPLKQGLFSGLEWAYTNVFERLAKWTVQDALPAFLNLLSGGMSLLSSVIEALKPLGGWLWDSFLQPIAGWTGGVVVSVLNGLASALEGISSWVTKHTGAVQAAAVAAAAFCGAWALGGIAKFIVSAGSLTAAIKATTVALIASTAAKVKDRWAAVQLIAEWIKIKVINLGSSIKEITSAFIASTAAKIKDRIATIQLAAEWAKAKVIGLAASIKETAVALAASTAAKIKDRIASIALTAELVKAKIAIVAQKVSMVASTAAEWLATAATTALGVAVNILTSPITLVIAAIAALIAIVVLLVENWDKVKEVASKVWNGIKSVWSSAASWFKSKVLDPIKNGFKLFGNGIISYYEGIANLAIKAVNKIIGAVNKIKFNIPDWVPVISGKKWGFNINTVKEVKLPRLADGAVFKGNDPYMAIVNDQKHGVNVESPLATIVEAMETALRTSDYSGSSTTDVNISFGGTLSALARVLNPYIEAETRRVGSRASTVKVVSV